MFSKTSVLCAFLFAATLFYISHSAPVETSTLSPEDIEALANHTGLADFLANAGDITIYNQTTSGNGTEKQLYVIKAVVYEIGILTDIDDNSTESIES